MKKIFSFAAVVALGAALLASAYTGGASKEAMYMPIGPVGVSVLD